MKKKLERASKNLGECLTVNLYAMVAGSQINENSALLEKKLKPVLAARFSADHRCLEGTREAPLERIMDWAKVARSPSKPFHVHGVAGSGKSSISSTVCERLEMEKMLAGAFFCKRDIPDQRDPNGKIGRAHV